MALLAIELPGPPEHHLEAPSSRFAANTLVEGMVAVPVRFADAGSAAFLRPGDHIDVLAAEDTSTASGSVPDGLLRRSAAVPGQGVPAAVDVAVLATPAADERTSGPGFPGRNLPREPSGDGGLVFLAVDNATSATLAHDAVSGRLSYALHPARPAPG